MQYTWARVRPMIAGLDHLVPALLGWITVPDNPRADDALSCLARDLTQVWRPALLIDRARRSGRRFRLRFQNEASGQFADDSYREGEVYRAVAEREIPAPAAATLYLAPSSMT